MQRDSYEFEAPQYFDFYSAVEGILEQNEDNSYLGSLRENVPLHKSGNPKDQNCIFSTSDFAVLIKPSSENLLSLQSGERKCSQKLSSVLCEEGDDHSSYVMKQAFSNALDNITLSPERCETKIPKFNINKQPFKEEAYLFSNKSKLNKKKVNAVLLVKDSERDNLQAKEDNRTYSGMATTRAYNRTTIVQPFSFQERDEEFLKRKQERLAKAREKTKTVTDFQARPVPSYILSNSLHRMNVATPRKNITKTPTKEVAGEENFIKAKCPGDLFRESFVPVKLRKSSVNTPKSSSNSEKITKENKIHQVLKNTKK